MRLDQLTPGTLYTTATGRNAYPVFTRSAGEPWQPIRGEGTLVRVEYVTDTGRHKDDYGYEDPATLTAQHKPGDLVWVHSYGAWRKGTVEVVGPVNRHRVKVRVVTNTSTGREILTWFGAPGHPPTYPGSFTDPPSYTCTEPRCGMCDRAMHGHPGNTVGEIKAAHERAWHTTMLRVVREGNT